MDVTPIDRRALRFPWSIPRFCPAEAGIAHLVGACGSGMGALGELMRGAGWTVTGSDLQVSEATAAMLRERGLRIHSGHDGGNLPSNADLLIYSPAVGEGNPERRAAQRAGIPQLSYTEMLGRLMRDKTGLSIAGTHGKSTTTAMTGWILALAGESPSVIVGAELREANLSGWAGSGDLFVVESCEFQRGFLNLSPKLAAILSIEPDHFDCYSSLDELIAAFAAFARKLPGDGYLLTNGSCAATGIASRSAGAEIETFGFSEQYDWWAADIRPTPEGIRFRSFHRGEFFAEISLRIPGQHNVLNALAATAMAHRAGADAYVIRHALFEFPGLRRRFEPMGSWRGVTLIDDYAHHPTAIEATLSALRGRFPRRRLWCVFQPHQISRTRALFEEFARSLTGADFLLVTPVFAARETADDEAASISTQLARRVEQLGGNARFAATLDHTLATLDDELRPGDVLMTMGAGDIGKLQHAFTRRLPKFHNA
jgi:UDP-N-acetylmuramate--alanine ligase